MNKNQNLNSKNNIIYSNKIFDSSNEERPGLILKELEEKSIEGKSDRILAILLKYKINGKEQEAIIGTLKNLKKSFMHKNFLHIKDYNIQILN